MNRTGHTLLEMMLSITLLSIISVSVGSAVLLASQTTPKDDSPTATLLNDSKVLARIAEDLAMARYVPERTTNAVTIVVADRTGDQLPDRIRYAWSGTAGMPLTVQLNDETATALIEKVDQFSLDYTIKPVVTTIPAAPNTSAEQTPHSVTTANDDKDFRVKDDDWVGQTMTPVLSGTETQYRVERVRISAKKDGGQDGATSVEIQTADGSGLPTGTVLDSVELSENDFGGSYEWHEVTFPNPPIFNVGDSFCLVLRWVSDSHSGKFEYDQNYTSATSDFIMIETDDGGATWSQVADASLLVEVDVTPIDSAGATGYDLTREYVTAIQLSLQSTAEGRSPLTRTAQLEQAPEVLTQFWEADFFGAPTNYDLNNDGSSDWVYNGSPGTNIAVDQTNGFWNASSDLAIQPTGTLPSVVRVNVRAKASNGRVVELFGPFHTDGGGNVLGLVSKLQEDGSGGQDLLIYNQQTPTAPIATISGLTADWIDLQLTLLPQEQMLYVVVNGVERGSAQLAMEADQGARGFWLDGNGSGATFYEARVTYGGSYVENADAPSFPLGGSSGDGGGGLGGL